MEVLNQKLCKFMYITQKDIFEETHFKLMNPPKFGRITDEGLQLLTWKQMIHCYGNRYCDDYGVPTTRFIDLWVRDPSIRTYESVQEYELSRSKTE